MADTSPSIAALMAELTLDEKAALTAGSGHWHTAAVERLGIGRLKVTDGPTGARGDSTSGAEAVCFPVGVALGASWDVDLLGRVGAALGGEARSKGAGVLLGPTVNLHRTPLAGRNFECYAEDPLLTGHLASAFIAGLQAHGVGASLKHFVANDSEYQRMTISSEVDERTLRELYLRPFEIAVTGDDPPWTIMASYNRINGTYACEHRWLLTDVLRGEWGYDGLVVSDWYAIHETLRTAVSGCDLEMPGPAGHLGAKVADAVRAGHVPEHEVDASVARLLQLLVRTGVLDAAAAPGPHAADADADERFDPAPGLDSLAREAAAAGMVLLRNDGALLPLDLSAVTSVAVIGPNAEVGRYEGGGSSQVKAHAVTHPLDGLRAQLEPAGISVTYARGCENWRFLPPSTPATWQVPDDAFDPAARPVTLSYFAATDLSGDAVHTRAVANIGAAYFGTNVSGLDPEHFSCRYEAAYTARVDGDHRFGCSGIGRSRVYIDGVLVADNWGPPRMGASMFGWGTDEAVGTATLVAGRSYQVVVEYARAGEGRLAALRFSLAEPVGDLLSEAVAVAAAADVAVVVVGSSPDCESEGYDRVTLALPGDQDELVRSVVAANPNTVVVVNAGAAVAMPWAHEVPAVLQVWFGGQAFGDALADVVTGVVEPGGRLPSTFGHRLEDWPGWLSYPGEGDEVRYGEGVFMGYRGFDELGIEPAFGFGHGLGYTTWSLTDACIAAKGSGAQLELTVTNTGNRAGSTVVQVYVEDVECTVRRPPRELAAFVKVHLPAGGVERVAIALDERGFAFWHPGTKQWTSEPGEFVVRVGESSRDLPIALPLVR
jgi:beta-glucosidase